MEPERTIENLRKTIKSECPKFFDQYAVNEKLDIIKSQLKKVEGIVNQALIFCKRSPATAMMEGFDTILLGRKAKLYSELREEAIKLLTQTDES